MWVIEAMRYFRDSKETPHDDSKWNTNVNLKTEIDKCCQNKKVKTGKIINVNFKNK